MARTHGTIYWPNGNVRQSGRIGDLPIGEAALAVAEGRVRFDAGEPPADAATVLAAVGVESLSELRELVDLGRAARYGSLEAL